MSFSLGGNDNDLLRGLLAGGRQGAPLDTGLDPLTMALLGVAQGAAKAAAAPPGPKGSAGWARALAGSIAGGGQGYMSGMAQERQRGLLESATGDMTEQEKQALGLLSPDQRGPALWMRQQQARKDNALSGLLGDMGLGGSTGTPTPGGMLATPQASPTENRSTVNDPGPLAPQRSTGGVAAPSGTAAPVFARMGDRPPPGANPNEHFGRLTQEANAEFGGDEAALARRLAEISTARATLTNREPVNVPYRANPGSAEAGRPFLGMPAPDGRVAPIVGQGRVTGDPMITNVSDGSVARRPVASPVAAAPAAQTSSLPAQTGAMLQRAEEADRNAARLEALGDPRASAMAQGLRQRATQFRSFVQQEQTRLDAERARAEDRSLRRQERVEDRDLAREDRRANEPTERVIDPATGQPVLRRRSEAVGLRPAPADPLVDQRGPSAYETKIGQAEAEWRLNIEKAGDQAPATIRRLDQFERALSGFQTGAGSQTAITAGAIAQRLGLPDSVLEQVGIDKNRTASGEQIAALGGQLLLGQLASGAFPTNNFSDADRAALERTSPALTTTPEGNRRLIAIMREGARRDAQVASAWRTYSRANGGSQESLRRFQAEVLPEIRDRDVLAPLLNDVTPASDGASAPALGGAAPGGLPPLPPGFSVVR